MRARSAHRVRPVKRVTGVALAVAIASSAMLGATFGATRAEAETTRAASAASAPKTVDPLDLQDVESPEGTSHRSGSVVPALSWIALQLIPSPELVSAHGTAHFGARWQVTPLLYSFGVHRGEPRLRSFLIEPILRHSGSLELFVSPEYLNITSHGADRWYMRPGLRAYFPLIERGDYLSCSIGTSYAIAPTPNGSGVGYEIGVYSFFGVLGVQITYAPARLPVDWIATLSFRYF